MCLLALCTVNTPHVMHKEGSGIKYSIIERLQVFFSVLYSTFDFYRLYGLFNPGSMRDFTLDILTEKFNTCIKRLIEVLISLALNSRAVKPLRLFR